MHHRSLTRRDAVSGRARTVRGQSARAMLKTSERRVAGRDVLAGMLKERRDSEV